MLHVKKENEIPIDSKYYQNNVSNSNLEEPSNSQNEKHFIPHVELATSQESSLKTYGKFQLYLVPTRTMEQNRLLNKPFEQKLHITDIKHSIIGIDFHYQYFE